MINNLLESGYQEDREYKTACHRTFYNRLFVTREGLEPSTQ
jgi:hypothetical protein